MYNRFWYPYHIVIKKWFEDERALLQKDHNPLCYFNLLLDKKSHRNLVGTCDCSPLRHICKYMILLVRSTNCFRNESYVLLGIYKCKKNFPLVKMFEAYWCIVLMCHLIYQVYLNLLSETGLHLNLTYKLIGTLFG